MTASKRILIHDDTLCIWPGFQWDVSNGRILQRLAREPSALNNSLSIPEKLNAQNT
jgi:hypothetical protein